MQPINTLTAIIRKIKAYFLSYFDDERGGDSYINEPLEAIPSSPTRTYTDGDDCIVLIEDGTTHSHVPIPTTIIAPAAERVTMDEFIRGRPSTLEDFQTAREAYVMTLDDCLIHVTDKVEDDRLTITVSATEPFTATSSSPPTPLPKDGPTDDIFIVSPTPSMETNATRHEDETDSKNAEIIKAMIDTQRSSSRPIYENQGTFTLTHNYIPRVSEEPHITLADIEAAHMVFVNATYRPFATVVLERHLSMDDTQREEMMNPMTPPRKRETRAPNSSPPTLGETSPTDSLKTPDTPENDIPWATADALRKN